jgi:hypothetical protein
MAVLLNNNAVGSLGGAVDDTTTSLPLLAGEGANFPSPGEGDYFPITLVKTTGELEVVHCTARTGDVLTVVRGREGTLARAFNAGERVSLRLTAQAISDMHAEITAITDNLAINLSAPPGTRMLFQQSAAPAGWTKDVANYNDHALRMVTGTVGNGGALDFSAAFATGRTSSQDGAHSHTITVNNHTLTISQIPAHVHGLKLGGGSSGPRDYISVDAGNDGHSYGSEQTQSTGSGGGHNHGASSASAGDHQHTLAMDVKYLDVILAVKD